MNNEKKQEMEEIEVDPAMYPALNEEEAQEFCENKVVCYLNINSRTEMGKEMLAVMMQAMPLGVEDGFSLVGTIRFRSGAYQFIIHEHLLQQTWYSDGEDWRQCETMEETERIADNYRGYSLQLEHVLSTVSTRPWPGHCVINQPLEL